MSERTIVFGYTNWRGERSIRTAVPLSIRFAATEWHPEPQWLVTAIDLDKKEMRDFALKDMEFDPVEFEL